MNSFRVLVSARPVATKLVSPTFPRLVRRFSTELPSYEFVQVSSPKSGVGLSTS